LRLPGALSESDADCSPSPIEPECCVFTVFVAINSPEIAKPVVGAVSIDVINFNRPFTIDNGPDYAMRSLLRAQNVTL